MDTTMVKYKCIDLFVLFNLHKNCQCKDFGAQNLSHPFSLKSIKIYAVVCMYCMYVLCVHTCTCKKALQRRKKIILCLSE